MRDWPRRPGQARGRIWKVREEAGVGGPECPPERGRTCSAGARATGGKNKLKSGHFCAPFCPSKHPYILRGDEFRGGCVLGADYPCN
jgi:hypothetical protein